MNPIAEERFDALAGYSRGPSIVPTLEVEWYEEQNERILGLLLIEAVDEEFGGLVFGRDGNGRFRWVGGTAFFPDQGVAREALRAEMGKQSRQSDASFEQGDELKVTTALLTPVVPVDRMSPIFRELVEHERFSPAKGIIEAMSPYFRDLDGNFIEQFQTTAFDARIFELYLFAMLHEAGYWFDQEKNAPDYHCLGQGAEFFVEAVTVQPTDGVEPPPEPTSTEERLVYNLGYAAIKFGGPLTTKLNKKYWEQSHVAGKPLILAIQDFHRPLSMMTTTTALPNYLYGWNHVPTRDAEGHLVITPERIQEHRYGAKTIPSGFFSLPGAEHISAVMHNPHATLPKFNRMGMLAGFGSANVGAIRTGLLKDHDHDASEPIKFEIEVRDPEYFEDWTEGLSIYHNPNALLPIDRAMFPDAAHHYSEVDGNMTSYTPDYFPMASLTLFYPIASKA